MKGIATHQSIPVTSAPTTYSTIEIVQGLTAILLPLAIVSSIVACRKYCSTVRRQRLQRLEKLWLLDYQPKN